ncbi:MAG: tRNA (guanosine(46)-N7)-methyltransferase TrmB [Planctomycetes bacterium]|nr:tRNA (guanosine(46)-N7)-methyltransferase TrmB [Planctomycetota bacterium]
MAETQPKSRPQIAVAPSELEALRWDALFGNDHDVELEIGCGKAGFLLRRAQAHPELNFLGIEWANEFYRFAVDRFERWGVPNGRIVRTDASQFIRSQCPRESLSALHVYHPDPWPKTRHHKRRLFQPAFVEAAVACLKPGARWAVQSDHAEYFEIIACLLRAHPQLEEIPFADPDFGVEADESLRTNFEIKYVREGRSIHRIAMRRRLTAT